MAAKKKPKKTKLPFTASPEAAANLAALLAGQPPPYPNLNAAAGPQREWSFTASPEAAANLAALLAGQPAPYPNAAAPGTSTDGQVYTPGAAATPGVLTPPVEPFMTAADQMDLAGVLRDFELNVGQIDAGLATTRVNNDYEKVQADKVAAANRSSANDNAAARGLFQSSIRDAELFDIEATQRLRKSFLDDQLRVATSSGEDAKRRMRDFVDNFQRAMNQRMADNAREAGAGAPQYQVEPTAAQPGTWGPASSAGASAGQPGTTRPGAGRDPGGHNPWAPQPQVPTVKWGSGNVRQQPVTSGKKKR